MGKRRLNFKIVKQIKKLENLDVIAFKSISGFLFKYRVRIYALIFMFVFRFIAFEVPYINVIFTQDVHAFDAIFYMLIIGIILAFNARKMVVLSIFMFIPCLVLTLLGQILLAEYLANVLYVTLLVAIIIGIISLVTHEN